MTAYISKSTDREGNPFYKASICQDGEMIGEIADYDRDMLEACVKRAYPGITVENG